MQGGGRGGGGGRTNSPSQVRRIDFLDNILQITKRGYPPRDREREGACASERKRDRE
jgi:hypothetical protein